MDPRIEFCPWCQDGVMLLAESCCWGIVWMSPDSDHSDFKLFLIRSVYVQIGRLVDRDYLH